MTRGSVLSRPIPLPSQVGPLVRPAQANLSLATKPDSDRTAIWWIDDTGRREWLITRQDVYFLLANARLGTARNVVADALWTRLTKGLPVGATCLMAGCRTKVLPGTKVCTEHSEQLDREEAEWVIKLTGTGDAE